MGMWFSSTSTKKRLLPNSRVTRNLSGVSSCMQPSPLSSPPPMIRRSGRSGLRPRRTTRRTNNITRSSSSSPSLPALSVPSLRSIVNEKLPSLRIAVHASVCTDTETPVPPHARSMLYVHLPPSPSFPPPQTTAYTHPSVHLYPYAPSYPYIHVFMSKHEEMYIPCKSLRLCACG